MTPTPTPALVQQLAERTDKTTPIGAAIREDLVAMCNADPFDLRKLNDIRQVAQHGRNLLACRNPVAAFDANRGAQSVINPASPMMVEGDELYPDQDLEGLPLARELREQRQEMIRTAMEKSSLAQAVKAEILEICGKEPFVATELLEIEQLAANAMRVLRARLGLRFPQYGDQCRGGMFGYGPGGPYTMGPNVIGYGQGGSLATSPETFGATVARELLGALRKVAEGFSSDPSKMVLAAATAREKGMDDVADRLEAKLRGETPQEPTPKEAEPCCGISPAGTATSGSP